jgi:hypothetical protein
MKFELKNFLGWDRYNAQRAIGSAARKLLASYNIATPVITFTKHNEPHTNKHIDITLDDTDKIRTIAGMATELAINFDSGFTMRHNDTAYSMNRDFVKLNSKDKNVLVNCAIKEFCPTDPDDGIFYGAGGSALINYIY